VDVVILALQMTMLAVTATTAAEGGSRNVAATSSSMELDRAERGQGEAEVEGEAGTPDEDVEERGLMESDVIDEEDKLVVVNVGVVETIKRLWDSEEPIVRRFR